LVAISTWSRRPLSACPTISSDVGGVDQVHADIERHVDLAPGALEVRLPDGAELTAPSKSHRPEGQARDSQARAAQLPVFHA
jgi:hypothetical protein